MTHLSQRELFLRHLAQTTDAPLSLEIERADGIYLYDTSGKEYIDLISGISVSNLGHRHPKVLNAIKDQLEKHSYLMVYGEYIQGPQVRLARKLAELLPKPLESVYFVNSGSEATEGALKLAKRHTGRTEIISFKNAYHGSTQGALSVLGNEDFKRAFRPLLPDIRFLDYNEVDQLDQITSRTACVIAETTQGEAGVIAPDVNYLKELRKRCTETGTLLILDEVQTGFGRTGTFFGFEQFDIAPDILILAKGMGGGMPLGAFISSREIMSSLTSNPPLGHISTYGGHPVSCAASLATVETLFEEGLIEQVKEKEELFLQKLFHPVIKDIRSKGLMIALEFEDPDTNMGIIKACVQRGIISDWFLFNDSSMRIAPPLIITREQIEQACEGIVRVLDEVA